MKFTKKLGQILLQLPGWHTARKIVVIESDDWGCWRSRDTRSVHLLAKSFPHILSDPYTRLDTLENSEDLEALFNVLKSVSDKNGRPAILTANTIVANPDFEKIKKSNYQVFFFKRYTDDLGYGSSRDKLMEIVNQGIREQVYRPQLHGREHLNVHEWLGALQNGHQELLNAFDFEMFGVPLKEKINKRSNVMAALDLVEERQIQEQFALIQDAQTIFEDIFGFKSSSFIAPSYIWHPEAEHAFLKSDIRTLQGLPYQYIPNPKGDWYKTKIRYTGKQSPNGITHLVRNVFFEPSLISSTDANIVALCLERIALAFKMKKPVIVCSHRLNFMGGLDERNRSNNLKAFKELLIKVVRRWPDVEFLSTDQLQNLMLRNEKKTG